MTTEQIATLASIISREDKHKDAYTLYTREEVAKMLKVHITTVNRMIKRGELSTVKFGGSVRIPQTAIDNLLKY